MKKCFVNIFLIIIIIDYSFSFRYQLSYESLFELFLERSFLSLSKTPRYSITMLSNNEIMIIISYLYFTSNEFVLF